MVREDFMRNLWRWKCDVPEKNGVKPNPDLIPSLLKTEWSNEFEKFMRNRLAFGAIRYGKMGHGSVPPGKPSYNRIKSIQKRLSFFEKTGNADWLVDVANMALLIFEERQHPNFHFESGDDGYHDSDHV